MVYRVSPNFPGFPEDGPCGGRPHEDGGWVGGCVGWLVCAWEGNKTKDRKMGLRKKSPTSPKLHYSYLAKRRKGSPYGKFAGTKVLQDLESCSTIPA